MKKAANRFLNALVSPFGLELVRTGGGQTSNFHHAMPTCEQRLKHAKTLGFNPGQVVDAGAYIGGWTQSVATIFPDSEFLVIEPNPYVVSELRETLNTVGARSTLVEKALAAEPGKLVFNIWGDPKEATSASLQAHVKGASEHTVDVEVDTLDRLLDEHGMRPGLVKLDLQGAEYGALLGAQQALKNAEMFIVEFGCLEAYIGRTTPQQLVNIFYENNYCLYDLVECHYRPYDGALTGGDFFFIKNDSPLRSHRDWD